MAKNSQTPPQLIPAGALQNSLTNNSGGWFDYLVQVYPHHTDYGGIVWHGTYIAWMEEARVANLRAIGIEYADLVAQGLELPVVEMSLRYRRSVRMGQTLLIRTRMATSEGVRIKWDYQIESPDAQELYVTAQVTLVTVDREKGKIVRQWPPALKEALAKLAGDASGPDF